MTYGYRWDLDKPAEASDSLDKLTSTGCRGFTASGAKAGEISYIVDAENQNSDGETHDLIHELVHVLSGVTTKILTAHGDNANEGFTEYYTRKICNSRAKKVPPNPPTPYLILSNVCMPHTCRSQTNLRIRTTTPSSRQSSTSCPASAGQPTCRSSPCPMARWPDGPMARWPNGPMSHRVLSAIPAYL